MLIYGVCISDIENINEEKAVEFLNELARLNYNDYLEQFLENQNDNGMDYSFNDWMYNFEADGHYGLSAFLKQVIENVEGINIYCDDPQGIHYLGLSLDTPWHYNHKTKNIAKEEYNDILRKYINKITDDILEIRYWSVSDDYDW